MHIVHHPVHSTPSSTQYTIHAFSAQYSIQYTVQHPVHSICVQYTVHVYSICIQYIIQYTVHHPVHNAKLSLSNTACLSFSDLCILLFMFLSLCRLCVCVFLCSHWSLVDVPLIFFCPADHVPDWQPRVLLGMVEARSVNVKKTTTTVHAYSLQYMDSVHSTAYSTQHMYTVLVYSTQYMHTVHSTAYSTQYIHTEYMYTVHSIFIQYSVHAYSTQYTVYSYSTEYMHTVHSTCIQYTLYSTLSAVGYQFYLLLYNSCSNREGVPGVRTSTNRRNMVFLFCFFLVNFSLSWR